MSWSGSKKKVKFLTYKDGKMVQDSDDEDVRDEAGDEQTQTKGTNLYYTVTLYLVLLYLL